MNTIISRRRTFVRASASLILAGSLVITSACSSAAPGVVTSPSRVASSTLTGVVGAVHFADGVLVIGAGKPVTDLFIDPMCPYCKIFEELSGAQLLEAAEGGTGTVRIHPVAILDRLSVGTSYSTRASAAMTDIAEHHPSKLRAFIAALYEAQPAEDTPGLSDRELAAVAERVGASLSDPEDLSEIRTWVRDHTARALTGPLTMTTNADRIIAVPTVIVDGHIFTGDSVDARGFAEFYSRFVLDASLDTDAAP